MVYERGTIAQHGHSPFTIITVSGLKQSARQPSVNNRLVLNGSQAAARVSNASTQREMLSNARCHLHAFLTRELNSVHAV